MSAVRPVYVQGWFSLKQQLLEQVFPKSLTPSTHSSGSAGSSETIKRDKMCAGKKPGKKKTQHHHRSEGKHGSTEIKRVCRNMAH